MHDDDLTFFCRDTEQLNPLLDKTADKSAKTEGENQPAKDSDSSEKVKSDG